MRVGILGLWHLGSVTAACLAAAGHEVIATDPDPEVVSGLAAGRAPLFEPGLDALVTAGVESGALRLGESLAEAEVVWVCFDTPVDDDDRADAGWVRAQFEAVADALAPGTLVLISSQVPAGFTRALADDWPALRFGCSPENLRLGSAITAFREPGRVVVGLTDPERDRARVQELLAPFTDAIVWMSVESAEMTKHALNAFLATSVTFANEVAGLCELVGADAREVAAGLKSEPRIGPRAYLAPGAAFAGGTLARDLRFLQGFGDVADLQTPLLDGVAAGNDAHREWSRRHLEPELTAGPVAVLGLTYKPGTSTLRRSAAVALVQWLVERGAAVRAYDPEAEGPLPPGATRAASAAEALRDAHAAVVATAWPEIRALSADDFAGAMARPLVLDEGWAVPALAEDPRITYLAPGLARKG